LHINNYRQHDLDLLDIVIRNVVQEVGYNPIETGHIVFNPKAQDDKTFIEDSEIAEYIQMSDVAVSATSGEGFGLLNVEAPACQIPVIATNFTTTQELLLDEYDGIGSRGIGVAYDSAVIHSFGTTHAYINVDKMVNAIDYLERNPSIRKEMGINGRKFVVKFTNWDYIVTEWASLIRELA
jgi:glycosyltransferase involved in cell wall biosynthesis